MARVLYAWELGGGLGHVMQALPLLRAYIAAGHWVRIAACDEQIARAVLGGLGASIGPAPRIRPPTPVYGHRPVSYVEILLQLGFGDENKLAGVVKAWLREFSSWEPDVVLLDHAPGAMLAAQIADVRHCTFGHGFFMPPRSIPLPPFCRGADEIRIKRSEALLLDAVNMVRTRFGREAIECLAQLLSADTDFLATWPELDHYPERVGGYYCGPVIADRVGKAPDWPEGDGPLVAVYSRSSEKAALTVAHAIASVGARGLVFAPECRPEIWPDSSRQSIRWATEPYDMVAACAAASVVVCNGSFGTVWTALLAGVPVLCLPLHQEQEVLTRRIVEQGLGLSAGLNSDHMTLAGALKTLLCEQRYRDAAQAIAEKYQGQLVAPTSLIPRSFGV